MIKRMHRGMTAGMCVLGLLGAARAQEGEGGWMPEMLYEPQMGAKAPGAVADLAAWAKQPQTGPEGRPLPLTGSWMAEGMWGPARFVELVKSGHHVLPTFLGVSSQPIRAYKGGVARLGIGPIGNNLLMRFHDGETDVKKVAKFRGRLAGFRFTHDAELPPNP